MLQNFKHIFSELPDSSRVWLYLANRKLNSTELHYAEEQLSEFLQNWKAHGKSLRCDGTILFSQYLILCVNEEVAMASGCSIDSSVHFVKSLDSQLNVDFFNRVNVLKLENENETITANYFETIHRNQSFLNPLIQNIGQLRNNWIVNPVI